MYDLHSIRSRWKFPPDYNVRCSQLLNTALNEVGMYQSWRPHDPGPEYPVDARFAALPVLTKRDIRQYFPDGVLPAGKKLEPSLDRGEIELVDTSGTTNDKITNIWNQKWWDASEKASWKLNSIATRVATGDHREAILVNPRNVGRISDIVDLPFEKRRLSRFLYLNEKTDPLSWPAEHTNRMIDELNNFLPAVLEANPSMLARFCRYITANAKSVFQPGIIILTYECPTRFHYRQIRNVFNVPIVSSYGSTETGYVFMECEEGRFHQNSEFCRVDFQPLKTGQGGPLVGRILVTPLGNPWSYYLRFDTGDLVTLEGSGMCPCGRNTGMVLSAVDGRVANLTTTLTGRLVTLSELDTVVDAVKEIEQYQLTQVDKVTYDLHIVTQRADKSTMRQEALELLKGLYGEQARVSVTFDMDIAPEASGKYLISKALFPIELDAYLDDLYVLRKEAEWSRD